MELLILCWFKDKQTLKVLHMPRWNMRARCLFQLLAIRWTIITDYFDVALEFSHFIFLHKFHETSLLSLKFWLTAFLAALTQRGSWRSILSGNHVEFFRHCPYHVSLLVVFRYNKSLIRRKGWICKILCLHLTSRINWFRKEIKTCATGFW